MMLNLSGLVLAAMATSAFATRISRARDWTTMPPSFVIEFAALLLVGPHAAILVAAAGAAVRELTDSARPNAAGRTLSSVVTVAMAIEAAGLAHSALGGTTAQFTWPAQVIPIAAAVVVYCLVTGLLAGFVAPLLTKQPADGSWLTGVLHGCPTYCIGSSLSVGLVEAIDARNWQVVLVAAAPLYFAYRVYCAHIGRLEEARRRRQVANFLDDGMAVVDGQSRVTLWDEGVAHLLGSSRERALGRSLTSAAPGLARTDLPRAISEVLASGSARTLSRLDLTSGERTRILQVKVLPVDAGAALLFHDVTEHTHAEQALKRQEERIALAVEGSNDGLWEWDLRSHEFYSSGRWKAMVGLPATAGVGRPEEWIQRVHPDDVGQLKKALAAYFSGKATQFQHEHRIRHADGTYRRFLCRGLAARGAGRRPTRLAGSLTHVADPRERSSALEGVGGAGTLDPLTGLCNRAVFVEGLGRRLKAIKEWPSSSRFAVLYLDLDRFKIVNDSLGHMVGDELLIAVSRRLEQCLRQGDALARLGGDEFAILLNELGDEEQANAIAFRIQGALSAPFSIGGRQVFTSASIGIAFARVLYGNPEEMMRDADTAMYHAKAGAGGSGGAGDLASSVAIYTPAMSSRLRDWLELESRLRRAVMSYTE